MRPPRVSLLLWALLAAAACARDLTIPLAVPPRVTALALLGREGRPTPDGGLPVLGGQLLAVAGAGFPTDPTQVQVDLGGLGAAVRAASEARLVVEVPALASSGQADLTVTTGGGFVTLPGAVAYLGPGQPQGLGTTALPTTTPLSLVAPVEGLTSGGDPTPFPDLAVAGGASDSALLVAANLGVALTTVPLGLVPDALAARVVTDGGTTVLQVLGLDRDGRLAEGGLSLEPTTGAILGSLSPRLSQTAAVTAPGSCELPALLFTRGGGHLAVTWRATPGTARPYRLAELVRDPTGQGWALGGAPLQLAGRVAGWAARTGTSVVMAGGTALELVSIGSSGFTSTPLTAGPGPTAAAALLGAGCAATPGPFGPLALAAVGPSGGPLAAEVLAVAYQLGGAWWVASLDLATGAVARAPTGPAAASVALVPSAPYPAGAPAQWWMVAAGLGTVTRYQPGAGGSVAGCPANAVATGGLSLAGGTTPVGPVLTTAGGSRVLAVGGDGELASVLPASMSSQGAVLRLAAYAGLATVPATVAGVGPVPLAAAEHAWLGGGLAAVDTSSAVALVPFGATRPLAALGGPALAHGAAWLDDGPVQALALAAEPPPGEAGARAQVVRFARDGCASARVRPLVSTPVAQGPLLLAQGPARTGALGPAGLALVGPDPAPLYVAAGAGLTAIPTDLASLACLVSGDGGSSWSGCGGTRLEAGVTPLEATLSAGDEVAAVRHLDLGGCAPCAAPFQCVSGACAADDLPCQRAFCPVAAELVLARPGVSPRRVSLPAAPTGVAADPGGGFLVTAACDGASAGLACFSGGGPCPRALVSGPGAGALLYQPTDGGSLRCLAVDRDLGGPVAVTPNGAEAWLVANGADGQLHLTRLALARDLADGALRPGAVSPAVGRLPLGKSAVVPRGFPPSGVAFSPDGTQALITVPGELKLLSFE